MQNFRKNCDVDLLIPGFCCFRLKIEVQVPLLELVSIHGSMSPCTLTTMSFGTWTYSRTTFCAILTTLFTLNSQCKSLFIPFCSKFDPFYNFFSFGAHIVPKPFILRMCSTVSTFKSY